MTYVMVVDDQQDLLDTLGRMLRYDGFEVALMPSARQAFQAMLQRKPDMLILDVTMPEMSGIDFCRQLRADTRFSALPILFLTASGSSDDIVEGFDAGGDDYVVKPYKLNELRARVSALMRRASGERTRRTTYEVGDLKLDGDTYQIYRGEKSEQLTSTEYRLLQYLMEHPNQALSPMHLLQAVWEYPNGTGDPDLVRAHIRNLRTKLEKLSERKYIRTIHGLGYMVTP